MGDVGRMRFALLIVTVALLLAGLSLLLFVPRAGKDDPLAPLRAGEGTEEGPLPPSNAEAEGKESSPSPPDETQDGTPPGEAAGSPLLALTRSRETRRPCQS